MHKSQKPVRKCHGCKLNLRSRCAVFPDPQQQWDSGKCRGFKNEKLYQEYLEERARHPSDGRKEKRQRRARLMQTEPHHSGTLAHTSRLAGRRSSP